MNEEKEIIIFQEVGREIEVLISPSEDTVWMSLNQISELFEKNKSTISRHINNILSTGELPKSTVAKNATELNIDYYKTVKVLGCFI